MHINEKPGQKLTWENNTHKSCMMRIFAQHNSLVCNVDNNHRRGINGGVYNTKGSERETQEGTIASTAFSNNKSHFCKLHSTTLVTCNITRTEWNQVFLFATNETLLHTKLRCDVTIPNTHTKHSRCWANGGEECCAVVGDWLGFLQKNAFGFPQLYARPPSFFF